MPGVPFPLAGRKEGDIDFYVVRENTEGEYSNAGGRLFEGTEREMAIQESVFTRTGTDRILKYAYELAAKRPKQHLTSATKSNGISIAMPFWDERVEAMAKNYPAIKKVLSAGPENAPLTRDMGGTGSTVDLGKAIAATL